MNPRLVNMPTYAIRALLTLSAVLTGCESDDDPATSHQDAALSDGSGDADGDGGARVPVSNLDAALPTEGRECLWSIAISCDGDEDCSDGQVCCGRYVGAMGSYEFIECRDSCEPEQSEYNLCHEGDTCAVEGRECRRSSVLPYAFLAICASPSTNAPTELTGGSAAGEINCGDEVTCSGTEKCCLSGVFDYDGLVTRPGLAYCVADADSCDCDSDDVDDGGI